MTIPQLLLGGHIRLTSMQENDLPILTKWFQNVESLRLLDTTPAYPKTEVVLSEWVKNSQKPKNTYLFAIRLHTDEKLIGYLEFEGIQWAHGTCGVAYLIGEPAERRKGYTFEAMQLGLKFAFHELNLYRITLTAFSYNQASLALAEKLGFKHEGIFREFFARDGARHNMHLYGLLRPEWEAQQHT